MSITATLTLLASWAVAFVAASMRRIPVGGVSSPPASGTEPDAFTRRSGVMKSTSGSACSLATWRAESLAVKPLIAFL